jgi:hypothetical protein
VYAEQGTATGFGKAGLQLELPASLAAFGPYYEKAKRIGLGRSTLRRTISVLAAWHLRYAPAPSWHLRIEERLAMGLLLRLEFPAGHILRLVALVIALFDTGGIHWFCVMMVYDFFRGHRSGGHNVA